MPLTIDYPVAGGPIGPGFVVHFSGAAGPVPVTDYYVASVVAADSELVEYIRGSTGSTGATFGLLTIGLNYNVPYAGTAPQASVQVGAPVRLLVQQFHENGTQVASISQAMVWDPTSMLYNFEQQVIGQGQTTGTFTPQDRQTIQTTEDATLATFPAQLGQLPTINFGLGDLVQQLPFWLASATTGVQIVGRGELQRPGGPFRINALGIQWEFVSVPPALGLRDGAVQEWYERLLQLVLIGRDPTQTEYVDRVVESSISGQRITWGLTPPYRLLYDVLPGVVVQYHWLLV